MLTLLLGSKRATAAQTYPSVCDCKRRIVAPGYEGRGLVMNQGAAPFVFLLLVPHGADTPVQPPHHVVEVLVHRGVSAEEVSCIVGVQEC